MFNFSITINGEDVTAYACYPLSGQLALDRGLDQAYIELKNSPKEDPYPPFSKVEITLLDHESTVFYVASDDVETIIKTGRSTHLILLTEETKILERVICPGKTFVQPLVRNYSKSVKATPHKVDGIETQYDISQLITLADLSGSIAPPVTGYYNTSDSYTKSVEISSVVTKGETPPSMTDVFKTTNPNAESNYNRYLLGFAIVAINRNLEVVSVVKGSTGIVSANQNPTLSTLPVAGYTLYYIANYRLSPISGGNNTTSYVAAAYDFAVIPPDLQKPPLYISDVTNQLLEIAEPIRYGESPRFTLSAETRAKYANTPCAELNFANGATLRENLDEIAGIVHCITRLKNGKVYFEELGQTVEVNYNKLGSIVSKKSSNTVEKYASHLDTVVDNLMNMQDPNQGAISDPFVGIYRTVRAETTTTDMRTTVDNCLIKSSSGVQKPIKLTANYNGDDYDLTPFLYEKKEYDLLETNGGVYPYAKSYALYYVQGSPNIYGLNFRPEQATDIGQAFQRRAIENVLAAAGAPVSGTWSGGEILDYLFNFQYIPAVRGRVRQSKKDIGDLVTESAVAFNQSAPRLSSVNYGERLKGEIAMMSEPTVKYCFKTTALSAVLDSVGKIYKTKTGRYYVSTVDYKIWKDYVIAELTLSKNFNQLGRFVSVNNSFRQFEIDDNSQEEMIVYEDYAVFTAQATTSNFDLSLDYGNQIISSIGKLFTANEPTAKSDISAAFVRTIDSENNLIAQCLLPVQSLALGNALLFNFSFIDNYSAGEFLQSQGGYKLTRQFPYGDPLYGEAKYLSFELWNQTGYTSDNLPIEVGDRIPLYVGIDRVICIATQNTAPIIINKSSRDAPNISYMIHHVTDSGFIFGSALLKNNPLVGSLGNRAAYMVMCPFELNPLDPPIPTFDQFEGSPDGQGGTVQQTTIVINGEALRGYQVANPTIEGNILTITNPYGGTSEGVKSWAIYGRKGTYADSDDSPADCEFLIGGNGDPPDNIYVYLKHKVI